jgi:hypothetical protein
MHVENVFTHCGLHSSLVSFVMDSLISFLNPCEWHFVNIDVRSWKSLNDCCIEVFSIGIIIHVLGCVCANINSIVERFILSFCYSAVHVCVI